MNLVLIGLNHKTAPVALRECLAPPPGTLEELHQQALALPGVREALILSTCNRVEVLAVADQGPEALAGLGAWLARGKPVDPASFEQALYRHQDQEAVRHLFRVASSLDSLVVGEPQILGQIKEAFRLAAGAGATRAVLNKLLHKTFQVAKRVRTETRIGGAAVSVSYAAVELAKKIFDDLKGRKVLLIGAGEMAELAAEHLLAQGAGEILVANRTLERAVELSKRLGSGAALGLGDLAQALGQVDIVISSTGASEPVITHDLARRSLKTRRGRPLFFIDIAVPRDIDPAINDINNAYVYDIDDLNTVIDTNLEDRQREAVKAERMIDEAVIQFRQWYEGLEVVPTIKALHAKIRSAAQAEMEKTFQQLAHLKAEDRKAIERMMESTVNKLLHDPTHYLRSNGCRGDRSVSLDVARKLFKLDE